MEAYYTDILVLGSGLSGLRAALAARAAGPELAVTVACNRRGPSGSSFTNRNDALGIQVPRTDAEREIFASEALRTAGPGFVDPDLVRVLAEEAEARFLELEELNLFFRRNDDRSPKGHPGCFGAQPTAFLFDDLMQAFNQLAKRTAGTGVNFLTGHEALRLLAAEGRILGATLRNRETGAQLALQAKVVIMACGGPASLFAHNLAGAGSDGFSYGLLAEAGVRLRNTPFVQFIWYGVRGGDYASPAQLCAPGSRIVLPGGSVLSLPQDLPADRADDWEALRAARRGHCPASHHLPDRALDELLLEHADIGDTHIRPAKRISGRIAKRAAERNVANGEDGGERTANPGRGDDAVRVMVPDDAPNTDREWFVAPHAQAGNGGAVIDADGATNIAGLYAVGECATGMHGADRLGGAMVLATQVFGERAGRAAAALARGLPEPDDILFDATCPQSEPLHGVAPEFLAALRAEMQRHAVLGGRGDLAACKSRLTKRFMAARDRREELLLQSALAVLLPMRAEKPSGES